MNHWGIAIPGLAMASTELPSIPGLCRSDNPEVGQGMTLEAQYSLQDVAELHVRQVEKLTRHSEEPFLVIGMSMGGMIASLLATEFRSRLPRNTRFLFLVTSSNSAELPAIPEPLLDQWLSIRSRSPEEFERSLSVLFSDSFRQKSPQTVSEYFRYRSRLGNHQRAKSFLRQVTALRAFAGDDAFSKIDPRESYFIGGAADRLLGPLHNARLQQIVPEAFHRELPDIGHMINLEYPEVFQAKEARIP